MPLVQHILVPHLVVYVLPVERRPVNRHVVPELKHPLNVCDDAGGGGGGARHEGDGGELVAQPAELDIGGAEVVAPAAKLTTRDERGEERQGVSRLCVLVCL